MKHQLLHLLLCLSVALAIGVGMPSLAQAQIRVVATIPDLGSIAEAVGGEDVAVDVLASPNEDPHFVDARPNYVLLLNRADALVAVGAELEVGWLPALQHQARNGAIQPGGAGFFDASSAVELIAPTAPVDRASGDVHAAGNPHYTRDPRQAARIARALGEHFAGLDAAHAAAYRQRATDFATAAEALADQQTQRFATIAPEARRVVGYHESLAYLLNWLGLDAVSYVEPLPGVPPTPRHTAEVLGLLRDGGVRVIVQESYYPRRVTDTLATQGGATVVELPGGVPAGSDYLTMMASIADALHAALAR